MKDKFSRIIIFSYGVICYLIFFGTSLYLIGFVGNILVPKALDSHRVVGLTHALLINISLLGLFALQHSGMARQSFKEKWTKIIPASIERSTYVLFSSLCLIVLIVFWEPIGLQVWHTDNTFLIYVLYALSLLGWAIVFVSTLMINHFDMFGLRQVYLNFKKQEYIYLDFQTPFFYSVVRHPIYIGFLFGIWFTPDMTIAHLIFAALLTVYILVAIRLEEKDLADIHGESYREYQALVPMLIPKITRNASREYPSD